MNDELMTAMANPSTRSLIVRALRSYHGELRRFADAFQREGNEPYATINDMAELGWFIEQLEAMAHE